MTVLVFREALKMGPKKKKGEGEGGKGKSSKLTKMNEMDRQWSKHKYHSYSIL